MTEVFHISPFYVYKIPKMESGDRTIICVLSIGITVERDDRLWKKKLCRLRGIKFTFKIVKLLSGIGIATLERAHGWKGCAVDSG